MDVVPACCLLGFVPVSDSGFPTRSGKGISPFVERFKVNRHLPRKFGYPVLNRRLGLRHLMAPPAPRVLLAYKWTLARLGQCREPGSRVVGAGGEKTRVAA